MGRAVLYLLMISYFFPVSAEAQEKTKESHNTDPEYFVGINPLASFTYFPNQYLNLYLPLATNLETGLALNGGIRTHRTTYEGRFSYGNPNKLYNLFQFHLGINYDLGTKTHYGLYGGAFMKYYHLNNHENHILSYNVIPYMVFGYKYQKKNRFFVDFRLNQTLYSISWSNQENTSSNADFHFSIWKSLSPILPYLSINIGITFN